MGHEKASLEDKNIAGTQVWKILAKALFIKLMNLLYYVPDYIPGSENTKVSIKTIAISKEVKSSQ